MNTFQIYEEFRDSLGEPAARALAHRLGAMFDELRDAVTKEDFRSLRESIDADVSRLDSALVELAQAQKQTEQRLDELAQAQKQTEQRLDELAQAQRETQHELKLLIKVVKRQADRLDKTVGRAMEIDFRDRMPNLLWRFLKQARPVTLPEIADQLEAALEESELEDIARADAFAAGLIDGKPAFVVAEISFTAVSNDVRRAARWAALFRKAGLRAIALVACDGISDRTLRLAEKKNVRVCLGGRLLADPAA